MNAHSPQADSAASCSPLHAHHDPALAQGTSCRPALDATSRIEAVHGRALVLGGGGSTGNAWLIGVLAGCFDAGLDLTGADLTVGTSAGSTAAAQISGAAVPELYSLTVAAPPKQLQAGTPTRSSVQSADATPDSGRSTGESPSVRKPPERAPVARTVNEHLDALLSLVSESADAGVFRRRIGAAAIERADEDWQSRWRDIVSARLPNHAWPDGTVAVTAVNARTGQGAVFDRHSGIDLIDAVAASCSSGPAYRIGDDHFIDGGYLRGENAGLARGCGIVVVLAHFGGRSLHPKDWRTDLASQTEELQEGGSQVRTLFPDQDDEHLFGANAMNAAYRPTAARAGFAQGRRVAEALSELWT